MQNGGTRQNEEVRVVAVQMSKNGGALQILVISHIYLRLCEAAQVGHSLPSVCVCVFIP